MAWSTLSRMKLTTPGWPWRLVVRRKPAIVVTRANYEASREPGAFFIVSGHYRPDWQLLGDRAGETVWLGIDGSWRDRMYEARVYKDFRTVRDQVRRRIGSGGEFSSITAWACELDAE